MRWLPPVDAFRERLVAVNKCENAHERLDLISSLARANLSYLETVQVDAALSKTGHTADSDQTGVRLAILAASTTDHLLPPIRVAGLRRGLRIETYASAFGQYRQELLDPTSRLHAFRPDTLLFSLGAQEFIGAVPIDASSEEAEHAVDAAVDDLRALWQRARDQFGALVIQQSFLDVQAPLFGGHDAIVPGAPARLVTRLNAAVTDAAGQEGVLWLDTARAAARDGLYAWYDIVRWFQAKMEIGLQAAPLYGDLVARLISAARGKSKKCLVLDLDNTLWGGVVGDDGLEGIIIGQGSAVGEAHLALQRYAMMIKNRGIILAVCSKNELAIAESVFLDHPEMLLKRDHFAAFVVNWNDKVTNLRSIAQQLRIGLDSLVFVDDNPVERAHVRACLPTVAVPEIPADPALFVRCIAEAGYFESVSFTKDDQARAGQYAANIERETLKHAAGDLDAFLRQLEMSVEFGPVRPLDVARVTQLINKTNQFNTTTIRRTEHEVAALASDPESILLQFRLTDKFGDNGIVSAIVLLPSKNQPDALEIDNWVMSCRVFGRQLEDEVMNIVVKAARRRGVRTICATFIPTEKNTVIKGLFEKLGFSRVEAAGENDGSSQWSLLVADYADRPTWITRSEQSHD